MVVSPRLLSALELVPDGASLADVCCDHGRLAIAAAQAGASPVIAIDVAEAPLAVARRNASLAGAQVELRLGDGLRPLRPGEVDGVVIAGVGGRTCLHILAQRDLTALGLRWLVLQVNRDLPKVRVWLAAHGWRTDRETLVRDGRRIFPTLRASPHHPPSRLTAAQAYLGELPRDAAPALHIAHLERRRAKLADEVRGLRLGRSPALLNERIAWLEAVETALRARKSGR